MPVEVIEDWTPHKVIPEPEVDFRLMLSCTKNVIDQYPLAMDLKENASDSSKVIATILNVKTHSSPRDIKQRYQKRTLSKYFRIQKKRGIEFNKFREGFGAMYSKAFCRAFKIITGHTFNSAYKLRIGKLIGLLPEEDIPLLRMHTYALKARVRTQMRADIKAPILEQLRSENETLTWLVALYGYGRVNLDSFKDLKKSFMQRGLTKAGWKFLCKQSKNWVLTAERGGRTGIIAAANNKVPYSLLKNKQMQRALHSFRHGNELTALFMKDYRKSGLPMCRWNPLPVLQQPNQGQEFDNTQWLVRREWDIIRDYLGDNTFPPVTTVRGLVRRAEEWHVEQRRNRGDRKHLGFPRLDGLCLQRVVDGFEFTWIPDSTALWEEGDKLHHCVGSYYYRCVEQKYAVWSVENKETGERATLGCTGGHHHEYPVFRYAQCYSYCNGPVSTELKNAVTEFIRLQNEDLIHANEPDPNLSERYRRDDSEHRPPAEVRRGEPERLEDF